MEPISIIFILEWNYFTLHVTRYSPAVVGAAHLHSGKGAVGLQKKKSQHDDSGCAHTRSALLDKGPESSCALCFTCFLYDSISSQRCRRNREDRSCLCEVLTADFGRSETDYFLAPLRHCDTNAAASCLDEWICIEWKIFPDFQMSERVWILRILGIRNQLVLGFQLTDDITQN